MGPNHPVPLLVHFATGSQRLLSLSAIHTQEVCRLLRLNCTHSMKHQLAYADPPGFLRACPHVV